MPAAPVKVEVNSLSVKSEQDHQLTLNPFRTTAKEADHVDTILRTKI